MVWIVALVACVEIPDEQPVEPEPVPVEPVTTDGRNGPPGLVWASVLCERRAVTLWEATASVRGLPWAYVAVDALNLEAGAQLHLSGAARDHIDDDNSPTLQFEEREPLLEQGCEALGDEQGLGWPGDADNGWSFVMRVYDEADDLVQCVTAGHRGDELSGALLESWDLEVERSDEVGSGCLRRRDQGIWLF